MMVINAYLTQATAPYGTHTWWRLYIDAGESGGTETQAQNLIFRTTSGGSQAATGGTAFAGGAGAATGLTNPADAFATGAYRRNVTSAWWIGYQFASPTALVEINLAGPGGGRTITKARLQYSDNSTTGSDGTWTDAFSIYDPAVAANENTVWPQDLTGASGYKAYRFVWTATPTANRTNFAELEMIKSGVDYTSSTKVISSQVAPVASLCDNDTTTVAASTTVSAGTVTMSMAAPVLITSYTVTSGNVLNRTPRDWTVDGSNDGSTWTNLSTKSGELFATNGLTKTYTI